jgi:uncharacterized spore protein YtfJ
MTTRDIFDRSAGLITAKRVFGDPYTSDGITVIPVASIRGAGGEAKAFATRGDARMRPTAQQVQPGWACRDVLRSRQIPRLGVPVA